MGTRSITRFFDGDTELVRVYGQYDGDPEGMGVDLAKLCDVTITNGIRMDSYKVSGDKRVRICQEVNGMGELAALVIMGLKQDNLVGNIYIESCAGEIPAWAEYVYSVRGKEGEKPIIICNTHTDPAGRSIFNPKDKDGTVFWGNAKQWLRKYAPKKVVA